MGGNLISIAERIERGIGLDVNPGYIRVADAILRKRMIGNIKFLRYDGVKIPIQDLPEFDLIFSIGVFERLPKSSVYAYTSQLKQVLKPGGKFLIYLLSERAKHSNFTRRLGNDAYVFWSEEEINQFGSLFNLRLIEKLSWPENSFYGHDCAAGSADVLIL